MLRKLSCILLPLALTLSAQANVKLPVVFDDHMVFQQQMKVPVWGWADPGEPVTVAFAGQTRQTTADSQGNWRVDLDPLSVSANPQTMTVAGKNTLTFQDVLVGDVWLCSGQSNMAMGLGETDGGQAAVAAVNDPLLRWFNVESSETDVAPRKDTHGHWKIAAAGVAKTFSGTGYYFIREIRKDRNIPIGVVRVDHGGTSARTWTSVEMIQRHVKDASDFQSWLDLHAQLAKDYAKNYAVWAPLQKKFDNDLNAWRRNVLAGPQFTATMAAWNAAVKKAYIEGKAPPPRPNPSPAQPQEPPHPEGDRNKLANVFNAKLYPLIPYAIKGVAWYQGESDSDNPKEYQIIFPLMIEDWRERWGEGDIPFVFVQLPNLGKVPTTPDPDAPPKPGQGGDFCHVREAQEIVVQKVPNTGEAIAIDVGDPYNVHPKDKKDVGYRLGLVARKVAYGENIIYSGPTYAGMKVEGNKIRISFDNIGTGLTIGVPPWTPSGIIPPLADKLKCFTIAGADQKWHWADAAIDGNDIIVSSNDVPSPVAVRYDWFNAPFGNLYNKEKLPAAPFRTDNWDK